MRDLLSPLPISKEMEARLRIVFDRNASVLTTKACIILELIAFSLSSLPAMCRAFLTDDGLLVTSKQAMSLSFLS